jgi:hypothetical protein
MVGSSSPVYAFSGLSVVCTGIFVTIFSIIPFFHIIRIVSFSKVIGVINFILFIRICLGFDASHDCVLGGRDVYLVVSRRCR